MQTNHAVDRITPLDSDEEVKVAPPVELEATQLNQVGGGLAPNGTWSAATTSTEAPNGTW